VALALSFPFGRVSLVAMGRTTFRNMVETLGILPALTLATIAEREDKNEGEQIRAHDKTRIQIRKERGLVDQQKRIATGKIPAFSARGPAENPRIRSRCSALGVTLNSLRISPYLSASLMGFYPKKERPFLKGRDFSLNLLQRQFWMHLLAENCASAHFESVLGTLNKLWHLRRLSWKLHGYTRHFIDSR
jgi:hypothetical protein